MAITNASRLADFGSGIGTAGAVIQIDNANQRVGIGTTNPQATLQVGTGVTIYGNSGIVSATSFYGDGTNLTNTGSTLSAAAGSQRVVLTGQTSGTMTASATDSVLTFAQSTGTLSATSFSGNLSDSAIKNYTEVVSVIGSTGSTTTLDLANGNVFTATLTSNCTFTFTTGVATGVASFTLILLNDATSDRSIVWPASVKWPNNVIPVRTTASNIWSFLTPNNGTTWYGNIGLYNLT